jgi:catechol 2,3-dioxygenase
VAALYRDVVGLAVIAHDAGTVQLGAGGVAFLELVHRPHALAQDPAGAGLFHTAFLLPARADLGRWLDHARRIGHRLEGAADHLVSEAVYFSDPEGNGIEIYADRPAASWEWSGPAEAPQVVMANQKLDIPGLLAAAVTPWTGAPDRTCIGHVHLRVGDVPKAVDFYSHTLGLAVTRIWPEAAFMSTGAYHHHIATNTWHSAGAGPRDPAQAGLAWVTMEAATDAIASAITRRGETAELRDPWGTQIKITTATV